MARVVQFKRDDRSCLNIRVGEVPFPFSNLGRGSDDLFTGGGAAWLPETPISKLSFS